MDNQNTLSKAELKTLYNFMGTELGEKVLANIKESQQTYLDAAMAGFTRGAEFTHECVVAAAAVGTIYQFLKPHKPKDDEKTKE